MPVFEMNVRRYEYAGENSKCGVENAIIRQDSV